VWGPPVQHCIICSRSTNTEQWAISTLLQAYPWQCQADNLYRSSQCLDQDAGRNSEQKTYCAAFCTSLALLAGLGNNASCNGSQWLERAADWNKVGEDVTQLIFLLGLPLIFSAFHCYKNKPPLPAEALLRIYSVDCLYRCNMYRVFVDKMSLRWNFLYTSGN